MKLRILVLFILVLGIVSAAAASTSANATLQVSGTVASSVSVSLTSGSGGATLGGSSTAATLALGTFGRTSTVSGWTTDTSSTSSYGFYTPVHVAINAANTSSTTATVTAYLSSPPATNVTFTFGGTAVTSTNSGSPTTIAGTTYSLDSTTQDYAGDNTVRVDIPDALASGTSITNTINLTVTVN